MAPGKPANEGNLILMEKKTILAAFAVLLVLFFLIEPFAVGILARGGSGESGGAGSEAVSGTVRTNVTVLRYEPYLLVSGNASRAQQVKEELVGEGVATYAIKSGDSLIVNLRGSEDVIPAARKFEGQNLSVVASASVATEDKLVVVGSSVSVSAQGRALSLQLAPAYEPGVKYAAVFQAAAADGQLVSMGSFSILPVRERGTAVAEVVSAKEGRYVIEVPWENRSAAKPIALSHGASYKEKSYILLGNATDAQLESAGALPFVTGVQAGIASVANPYSDRQAAEARLRGLGIAHEFPPSAASFNESAQEGSELALYNALAAAGINATLVPENSVVIRLPGTIKVGERSFLTGSPSFEVEGANYTRGQNVTVALDFEANGMKLLRVYGARIAE
jgi:hypothetical protein